MPSLQKGFTLVEISITTTIVVLLGILLLIGINPIMQIFKGYDAVRKADLVRLRTAFEAYYEDHSCYPPLGILSNCGGPDLQPYLESIPCDPNSGEPYVLYIDPAEAVCPQNYAIYASLTNMFDPQGDFIADCLDTYAVYNPSARNNFIRFGCSGESSCNRLYGCIEGVCELIAEDSAPTCGPAYCASNCYNLCGPPARECQ